MGHGVVNGPHFVYLLDSEPVAELSDKLSITEFKQDVILDNVWKLTHNELIFLLFNGHVFVFVPHVLKEMLNLCPESS